MIMLIMVMIPTFSGHNLEEHYIYLVVAYTITRLTICGFYWTAQHKYEEGKKEVIQLATWYAIGAMITLSSILFEGKIRYTLFFAGIVFDWIMPLFYKNHLSKMPVHIPHLVERTGLFVIILMGESVISLMKSLQNINWAPDNVFSAITGFILLGAMWWIYFDSFNNLERAKRSLTGSSIIYSHLMLCSGVLIMASVVRYGIIQDISSLNLGVIAVVGMMFFYIGKQIPYYILFPNMRRELVINSVVVTVVTAISCSIPNRELTLVGITLGLFYYVYANLKLLQTKDVSAYVREE